MSSGRFQDPRGGRGGGRGYPPPSPERRRPPSYNNNNNGGGEQQPYRQQPYPQQGLPSNRDLSAYQNSGRPPQQQQPRYSQRQQQGYRDNNNTPDQVQAAPSEEFYRDEPDNLANYGDTGNYDKNYDDNGNYAGNQNYDDNGNYDENGNYYEDDPEMDSQQQPRGQPQRQMRNQRIDSDRFAGGSWAAASNDPEQSVSRDGSTKRGATRDRDDRAMLCRLLVVACICLLLVTVGAAVAIVVLFILDSDDTPTDRTVGIAGTTSPPTVAPITVAPTRAPTVAPVTASPTKSPTRAPTTPAPTAPKTWQQQRTVVTNTPGVDTNYGNGVALAGTQFLAIGEPNDQTGQFTVSDRSNNWQTVNSLSPTISNTLELGFAVDGAVVNGIPSFVVGAIDTLLTPQQSQANFGSAHYYQRNGAGQWSLIGNFMRPAQATTSELSGGEFGSSVAMATDVMRVAIGMPNSGTASLSNAGRVYTYEYDSGQNAWQLMADPLVGWVTNQRMGTSVAMSKDGSRMLVGSPGDLAGTGTFFYYEWDGSTWKSILSDRGTSNSAMGTSVAIISDDGRRIALGMPSHGTNEQGGIRVYQESTAFEGFFDKQGGDAGIVGAANNERIGRTLTGAQGRVAFGTEQGSFRAYEYAGGGVWDEVAQGPTGLGSRVVSISMSADSNSVAVGTDQQRVSVYDLA